MVAATNQDFISYSGDDIQPIITVYDSAGTVLDISSVTEIRWWCYRNEEDISTPTIEKLKSTSGIVFITDGTDGKFRVLINAANTTGLTGMFIHAAQITSGFGRVSTITIGRMSIGQKPLWTYEPSLVTTTRLYQVRLLIGDTIISDQMLFDAEINWAISVYPTNAYLAAAECCRILVGKFSRLVDIGEGNLQKSYSEKQAQYRNLAKELEGRGLSRGGIRPYIGGISQSNKISVTSDPDRVSPQFNIAMQDNLIVPVGPVGNEVNSSPMPDGVPNAQ